MWQAHGGVSLLYMSFASSCAAAYCTGGREPLVSTCLCLLTSLAVLTTPTSASQMCVPRQSALRESPSSPSAEPSTACAGLCSDSLSGPGQHRL